MQALYETIIEPYSVPDGERRKSRCNSSLRCWITMNTWAVSRSAASTAATFAKAKPSRSLTVMAKTKQARIEKLFGFQGLEAH